MPAFSSTPSLKTSALRMPVRYLTHLTDTHSVREPRVPKPLTSQVGRESDTNRTWQMNGEHDA